ncbi:MAG: glutamate racemase [bacterium]|jgi:glutamate racemase
MAPSGTPPPVPVGMFDSGIGGLTVYKELMRHAPSVPVLYFGDTYHVPYGSRPLGQIRQFALNAIDFLASRGAQVVAVACNVSSSVLTKADIETAPVPVFGLVAGGAQHAVNLSRSGKIGVIATEATIKSGSYQREITVRRTDALVVAVPSPKLVPLIEEGQRDTDAVYAACREYLEPIKAAGCDTVVHGCTHYPLLQDALSEIAGPGITFVDPAAYLAVDIVEHLFSISANDYKREGGVAPSRVFLSKHSESFVENGSAYLGFDLAPLIEIQNINAGIAANWEARVG